MTAANGARWESFGEVLSGTVYTMHVHEGKLYIGGNINQSGGIWPHWVSWDGTTMESLGTGLEDPVYALESNGEIPSWAASS